MKPCAASICQYLEVQQPAEIFVGKVLDAIRIGLLIKWTPDTCSAGPTCRSSRNRRRCVLPPGHRSRTPACARRSWRSRFTSPYRDSLRRTPSFPEYPTSAYGVKGELFGCCSKVNLSGVNSNVIMSGCGDDNPDDEGREAARDHSKSVSRQADGSRGGFDTKGQRAAMLPDQGAGVVKGGAPGLVHGNRRRPSKHKGASASTSITVTW